MSKFLYFVVIALCLVSCKTKEVVKEVEVPVTVETIRDVYHNTVDTVRDSIYHDVFVNQYIKGDTVYNERVEYLVKDRWRVRDSIRIQRDTIPQVLTITKTDTIQQHFKVYVPGQMTKWQSFRAGLGTVTLILLLCALAYLIYKVYRKFKLK